MARFEYYGEKGLAGVNLEELYESFVEYQTRILREFDNMAAQYNFNVIDAAPGIEEVFEHVRNSVEPLLNLHHLPR